MRIAILSDVHGNSLALDAVLEDIGRRDVDRIVNLGDHASGPLEPARAVSRLMEIDALSIRGNHDRWLIETARTRMGPSDAFARDDLDQRQLDWLSALPATVVFEDVFLCHATPSSDTTYWLEEVVAGGRVGPRPVADVERLAVDVDASLILCGHTHLPRLVRLDDGRLIVNPGSVGAPAYEDDDPAPHVMEVGAPHASYAIADRSKAGWSVAFHRVVYDWHAMSRLAARNCRPEWARALATGRVR